MLMDLRRQVFWGRLHMTPHYPLSKPAEQHRRSTQGGNQTQMPAGKEGTQGPRKRPNRSLESVSAPDRIAGYRSAKLRPGTGLRPIPAKDFPANRNAGQNYTPNVTGVTDSLAVRS